MPARSMLDSLAALASKPRAMAALLERTERYGREELERHQLLRLERLLAHARENVPFYAALPVFAEGELTLERFRELSLLGREDVLERAAELKSRAIGAEHRIVREASSSGSTGRHVTVQIDAVSAAMGDALALRGHAWHRRDLRCKAAGIRAIPKGADAPDGRTERAWSAHPNSGPLVLLDVHTSVREQLAWLVREAPAYLATYATNAAALVEYAEREQVRLPGLRELGTFGEVLPDGLREAARRVWGAPVVDSYSTVELGFVAIQCPDYEHYHLQAEHLLVEILRPDGSACAPGETGRVVATALHAFAMPLIRYEVGDHAVVGEPCRCGRGLPVIERILGRSRNMLRLPSGDVLWPRYGSMLLGKLFPMRQFRLVQKSFSELELELVAKVPLGAGEERRLRELVLEIMRHPFELELRYVDAIPRSPSGKFEDFVCEIPAPALDRTH